MPRMRPEEVAAVLAEVPDALMKLAQERDDLRQKYASASRELARYHLHERIEKIATQIQEKHLNPGLNRSQLVDMLEKKAAEGRLDAVEQAVDMSAAHRPLGQLGDYPTASAASQLESFLLEGMNF